MCAAADALRDNAGGTPVKKVEHAVVHAAVLGAKLVDSIAQIIHLGAAQLVAKLFKAVETDHALRSRHRGERSQPVNEWDLSILFTEEDDRSCGHQALHVLRKLAMTRQLYRYTANEVRATSMR